jgi:hypothetical protein
VEDVVVKVVRLIRKKVEPLTRHAKRAHALVVLGVNGQFARKNLLCTPQHDFGK